MAQPPMLDQVRDFLRLTTHHRGEPAGAYDDAAAGYDIFADVFDRTVGAPALARFERLLADAIPTDGSVLDVAAGTGRRTERVLSLGRPARVVAADASIRMLDRARDRLDDARVEFVHANALALPFEDGTFDVVTNTWLLSILSDPTAAVQEFLRVLKPGGRAIYAFLSQPPGTLGDAVSWVAQHVSPGLNPLTHTLSSSEQPLHDCDLSSLDRYMAGFTTVVSLGSCCSVGPSTVPCTLER